MGIDDRVAVITGAAGGLGRVVARRLAGAGARLALFGTRLERLEQLGRDLALPEDRWLARAFDFAEPGAGVAAAEAVRAKFGRADILLHLIGGWAGGKPVAESAADEVSAMLRQHLWTTLHVTQAFVPLLVAGGWGRIVTVSSPQATAPAAKGSPYAIGKAAQEALLLTVAEEVRGTGVTANVLHVRAIDMDGAHDRGAGKALKTTPDEIAAAILYLCSEEAGVVNGARIPLTGGG